MNFDVFDSKNPERKLGVIDANPRYRCPHFHMAIMDLGAAQAWADYNPEIAPTIQRVEFKLVPRSSTEEVATSSRFTSQRIITEWTVFETSAPLDTLMQLETFIPEGFNSLRDRIRRGRY